MTVPDSGTDTAASTIHIDESGNTGENLLDAAQPVFVLSAVYLSEDEAKRLAEIVSGDAAEPHYTSLRRRPRGQAKVLALLTDPALRPRETVRVSTILKPFMVVAKIVDLLIEPMMFEQGADLYREGWHTKITEVFASMGAEACPTTWQPLLRALVSASRSPSPDTAAQLVARLLACIEEAGEHPVGEFLELALATPDVIASRLAGVDGYRSADALDPALTSAYEQASWWGEKLGRVRIVHDESKMIGRWRARLLEFSDPGTAEQYRITDSVVPPPLRLVGLDTAISHDSPAIQVADVVAGACADVLRAAASSKKPTEWGLHLREAKVLRFVDHLVWWGPGTLIGEEYAAQGLLGSEDDDAA